MRFDYLDYLHYVFSSSSFPTWYIIFISQRNIFFLCNNVELL